MATDTRKTFIEWRKRMREQSEEHFCIVCGQSCNRDGCWECADGGKVREAHVEWQPVAYPVPDQRAEDPFGLDQQTFTYRLRVPGGWLYRVDERSQGGMDSVLTDRSVVFVPKKS